MSNFLIGEYLAKLQARAWLSHALCTPGQHTAKRRRRLQFDIRITDMSLWLRFLVHPVVLTHSECYVNDFAECQAHIAANVP